MSTLRERAAIWRKSKSEKRLLAEAKAAVAKSNNLQTGLSRRFFLTGLIAAVSAASVGLPKAIANYNPPQFPVEQFGAVGLPSLADDAGAFQRALDFCASLPTGGCVNLGAKKYKIGTGLTWSGTVGLTIQGVGKDVSIIQPNGANITLFTFDSVTSIDQRLLLRDFGVLTPTGATSGSGSVCVEMSSYPDFMLSNIAMTGFDTGINVAQTGANLSAVGGHFDRCEFQDINGWGIQYDAASPDFSAQNVQITNCEFGNCGTTLLGGGCTLKNAVGFLYSGNDATGNYVGLRILNCAGGVIQSNYIESSVNANLLFATDSQQLVIVGNWLGQSTATLFSGISLSKFAWNDVSNWAISWDATCIDNEVGPNAVANGGSIGATPWTAASLTSNWTNRGSTFADAGYRLGGQVVYLQGLILAGSGSIGSAAFTMAARYRPRTKKIFVCGNGDGSVNASIVIIDTDGTVTPSVVAIGTGGSVSLEGINYVVS